MKSQSPDMELARLKIYQSWGKVSGKKMSDWQFSPLLPQWDILLLQPWCIQTQCIWLKLSYHNIIILINVIPGSAYGELGCLHSLLGNFEQAISCLQHQLRLAQDMGDQMGEGDAACGLGGVYQQMGEYEKALQFHQLDLQVAEMTSNPTCQCE